MNFHLKVILGLEFIAYLGEVLRKGRGAYIIHLIWTISQPQRSRTIITVTNWVTHWIF